MFFLRFKNSVLWAAVFRAPPPTAFSETTVTAAHLSQGEAHFPCLPQSSSKDTFPSRAEGPLASKGTGNLSPPERSIKGHPGNLTRYASYPSQ